MMIDTALRALSAFIECLRSGVGSCLIVLFCKDQIRKVIAGSARCCTCSFDSSSNLVDVLDLQICGSQLAAVYTLKQR